MATRTASLAPTNNTDANFRLWINEVNNALIAFGWLSNGDTGAINFSTVTRPTAINTYQGFAMYKMNDALQSTTPILMRIDFGTGGSTDSPAIKVAISIGTSSAGTFTVGQPTSSTLTLNSAGVSSATVANCYSTGDTDRFSMHFWSSTVNNEGWTVSVERDKDTSGANTSLGVSLVGFNTNGTVKNSQFLDTLVSWPLETVWYAFISSQSTQSGGGNIGIAPVRVEAGPFRPPLISILLYARGDFTILTTTSVTIYGVARTYLLLRPNSSGAVSLNTLNADTGLAMLWQ